MKQKLLNFTRLRSLLLLAVIAFLGAGQAWGDDVTLSYSGSTTTNMTGNNDAATVGLSATDWSVVGAKGDGTNFPGLNKDGTIRLYASSGNGSFITVTNSGGNTISSITLNVKSGTATVLVGENEISGNNNVYSINSTSFIVANHLASGQVHINSITITYTTAAPAYTITAQSNNNSYGTVSLSGSVITGSPESGYRYANPAYTVSPANSATVSQNGNAFTVTPSANTTVTINFEAIPTYTVTFSDGGSVTEALGGAGVTLPSRSALNGYEFAGWSETNVSEETTTAPTIIPAGTYNPTTNITLYPVYTKAGGGAAAPSPFSVGDTGDYAIVSAEQNGKYYALPTNPTVSSGKITAQEITVSESSGVKYVTTANASGFTWTIAAGAYGYTLFDGDKYFYHSNGGASGTNVAYGTSTTYTWSFTADGDYVTMTGKSSADSNNSRGMLFSGTTIGGYALSNANSSGYYKVMILPISAGSITYYWSSPVAAAVEQPIITVGANPFLFSTTATITCATDGATIKYSYDNSTWNDYSSALTITETKTIYAKAIKGDDESDVASVSVTKNLASPTVTVSGDLTLDLDGETNVSAGTLTAAVTYENAAVAGATVTWSSSNTDIATIDASGAVTIKTTGEVTFTATYAANSDYAEATGTKTVTVVDSNAPGSEGNPYTVAQAIDAIDNGGNVTNVYVSGIVSQVDEYLSNYNSITYWISDDGLTTTQFEVYSGKGLSGANFSSINDIETGDRVVVKGNIKKYNDVYEFNYSSQLVSHITKTTSNLTKTNDISLSMANPSVTATATDYFTTSSEGALSYEIADDAVATVSAAGVVTPVAAGTTTLTVSQAADATYKAGSLEITVTVAAASLNSTTIVANASGSTTYGTNKEETYMIDDTYDGTVAAVSSNPAVATVAITQHTAGEGTFTITPVAVGTAVITISAPATATCEAADDVTYTITVTAPVGGTTAAPASVDPVTIDFTGNAFSLSTSNTDTTTGDITDGTYTLNVSGGNGAYYYSDGDALLMGKSGATLTLPIFNNEITKIEVTGSSKAGTSVKQNIFVGETAVSTETTGAKDVTNVYEINPNYQTAGTQYLLKVTSAHNTQISSIKIYFASTDLSAKLNASGYATFCSEYPLDFSDDSEFSAWEITNIEGTTITFNQITGSVKGGTGVFLKGEKDATVTLTSTNSTTELGDNYLEGTLAPTYVEANKYYGLSGQNFVKINAGTVPAGKAILDADWIDTTGGVKAFTFVFESVDGIKTVEKVSVEQAAEIFNLAGQRLQKAQRGVNIINGKKVLVK